VPQRLRDLKLPEADLPRLAREAVKIQRLLKNNPREVTEADALAMHLLAWSQGIATLANAFNDENFIRDEVRQLHDWLKSLAANCQGNRDARFASGTTKAKRKRT